MTKKERGILLTELAQMPESQFRDISECFGVDSAGNVIALRKLSLEESRDAYRYRPFSKYAESHYGGSFCANDQELLASKRGFRCEKCLAVTLIKFLNLGVCPDCDGRSKVRPKPHHHARK